MVQRPSLPPRLVRPFPVKQWFQHHHTAPLPAAPQPTAPPTPPGTAARRGPSSAPASLRAGAVDKAPSAGALPALSEEALDLALLVSCLPPGVRDWLACQMQALAAQRGQHHPPGAWRRSCACISCCRASSKTRWVGCVGGSRRS